MTGEQIVERARRAKESFGTKCSKFVGAATVEILRTALRQEGIPVSPRDVFIRGIPVEIDLIVPRQRQRPRLGVLYEPEQVLAALEIKSLGAFGKDAVEKIRRDFNRLHDAGIRCAYVTLEEQKNYRWAISEERLGFRCFTLAWHKTTGGPFKTTGEWTELVTFLRERSGASAC